MKVVGIVLAGGKSTRMGEDKAFLEWNGKLFLQYCIDALNLHCSEIFISGDNLRLVDFDLPVIQDLRKDEGPVTALASCFASLSCDVAVVLSCDVPQIMQSDIASLLESHASEQDVTMFSYQGKALPLVGVYSRKCFGQFTKAFEDRTQKLFGVIDKLNTKEIEFKGPKGLHNINTQKDLAVL